MHRVIFLLRWSCLALLLASLGCTNVQTARQATTGKAADPSMATATFSLQKLTCEGCGARVLRVLKMQKGIQRTHFDKHKVEVEVTYQKAQINEQKIVATIQDMGFVALPGAGKGRYKPSAQFTSAMDVKHISKQGEAVDIKAHLAPGKITVVDFYAVWCGPCKDVDHALFGILQKNPNVALRKINVVDWKRPVVKQYMTGISELPYLLVYNQQGTRVATLVGRKIDELKQIIAKLSQAKP